MNTKLTSGKRSAEHHHFSSEDKIRTVLDDLRGEDGIAELCRKEGIAQSLHTWSKEFLRTLLSLGGIVADQKWRLP